MIVDSITQPRTCYSPAIKSECLHKNKEGIDQELFKKKKRRKHENQEEKLEREILINLKCHQINITKPPPLYYNR